MRRTVRGLLGVATAPAGAAPPRLIRIRTASFFSAAGGRFFLTVTISLWVATASFVVAAAGKAAVALETSARTATAATRTRRNMHQEYGACPLMPAPALWRLGSAKDVCDGIQLSHQQVGEPVERRLGHPVSVLSEASDDLSRRRRSRASRSRFSETGFVRSSSYSRNS